MTRPSTDPRTPVLSFVARAAAAVLAWIALAPAGFT